VTADLRTPSTDSKFFCSSSLRFTTLSEEEKRLTETDVQRICSFAFAFDFRAGRSSSHPGASTALGLGVGLALGVKDPL